MCDVPLSLPVVLSASYISTCIMQSYSYFWDANIGEKQAWNNGIGFKKANVLCC